MRTNILSKTTLALGLLLLFFVQASYAVTTNNSLEAKKAKMLKQVDPELRQALEMFPKELSLITRDTVGEARTILSKMFTPKETEGVTVTKKTISSPEGDITVYIYQPKNSAPNRPGMLWIHGGGYILGNAYSNEFAGDFAKQLNATVVSVEYRLAPEHPFPAGLNDCYAALLWMVKNANELGIDTNKIVIGGDSAGAGMAAGLVLRDRDEKGPRIAFQFLLYPMLDNLHATPSGSQEGYPVWDRQTSFNAWEMYLNGTPGKNASPYAAAARAKDLSGLPPTFIVTGTVDLFRDEIIDYAQRLMAAGVPTQLAVFPGMYHAGQMFAPNATVSKRMINTYVTALKDALNQK